ncbi:MAG: hypothetical protein NUW37_13285 [Planctomycetes bacterium]|nr:hypothetical protein [Planctomycetota bacterium]
MAFALAIPSFALAQSEADFAREARANAIRRDLVSGSAAARIEALRELMTQESPKMIPEALANLEDERDEVQIAAIEYCVKFRDYVSVEAKPTLLQIVGASGRFARESARVREAAANVFSKVSPDRVDTDLLLVFAELLRESDVGLRVLAAEFFGGLRIDHYESIVSVQIANRLRAALSDHTPLIRGMVLRFFTTHDSLVSEPMLVDVANLTVDDDAGIRRDAFELARRRSDDGIPLSRSIFERAIARSSDADQSVRRAAMSLIESFSSRLKSGRVALTFDIEPMRPLLVRAALAGLTDEDSGPSEPEKIRYPHENVRYHSILYFASDDENAHLAENQISDLLFDRRGEVARAAAMFLARSVNGRLGSFEPESISEAIEFLKKYSENAQIRNLVASHIFDPFPRSQIAALDFIAELPDEYRTPELCANVKSLLLETRDPRFVAPDVILSALEFFSSGKDASEQGDAGTLQRHYFAGRFLRDYYVGVRQEAARALAPRGPARKITDPDHQDRAAWACLGLLGSRKYRELFRRNPLADASFLSSERLEALERSFEDPEEDRSVRVLLAQTLGEVPSMESARTLTFLLENETDGRVRVQTAISCAELSTRFLAANIAEGETNHDAVIASAVALERAVDAMISLVGDPSCGHAALAALREITEVDHGTSRTTWLEWWNNLKLCRERLEHPDDFDPFICATSARWLGTERVGRSMFAYRPLVSALSSESSLVKMEAAKALTEFAGPSVAQRIALLQESREDRLRMTSVEAFLTFAEQAERRFLDDSCLSSEESHIQEVWKSTLDILTNSAERAGADRSASVRAANMPLASSLMRAYFNLARIEPGGSRTYAGRLALLLGLLEGGFRDRAVEVRLSAVAQFLDTESDDYRRYHAGNYDLARTSLAKVVAHNDVDFPELYATLESSLLASLSDEDRLVCDFASQSMVSLLETIRIADENRYLSMMQKLIENLENPERNARIYSAQALEKMERQNFGTDQILWWTYFQTINN